MENNLQKEIQMANWFTINEESIIGQVIIADDFETAKSFLGGNPISSDLSVSSGWVWDAETLTAKQPRPPQPYLSWSWEEETQQWRAPVGNRKPQDGKNYEWQEDSQTWLEI
jgi:hypothetical protein